MQSIFMNIIIIQLLHFISRNVCFAKYNGTLFKIISVHSGHVRSYKAASLVLWMNCVLLQ